MKKPKVSIVLGTYNSEKFVEECLASIKDQSFKDYELIILDEGSTDNTIKILKKLGCKFEVNKERLGCYGNFNKGIKLAKGDFIFTLDHDMVYDKDCLKNLLETINSDKKAGIACCRSYYYKKKNKIRSFGFKINLLTSKLKVVGRDEIDNGQFDNLKEVDGIGAGSMLIKRELIDKIGLFSEDYFLFSSDIDFSLKAKKIGYKILLSNAKSWHKKEEKDVFTKERFEGMIQDKLVLMKNNAKSYALFLILFLLFYVPIKIIEKPKRGKIFLKILKKEFLKK